VIYIAGFWQAVKEAILQWAVEDWQGANLLSHAFGMHVTDTHHACAHHACKVAAATSAREAAVQLPQEVTVQRRYMHSVAACYVGSVSCPVHPLSQVLNPACYGLSLRPFLSAVR